jgi:hypothetical protein
VPGFLLPQDAHQESSWELYPLSSLQDSVLQPPLFNLRYKFELPLEFTDLVIHPSQTAPRILRRTFLSHTRSRFLSHSVRVQV